MTGHLFEPTGTRWQLREAVRAGKDGFPDIAPAAVWRNFCIWLSPGRSYSENGPRPGQVMEKTTEPVFCQR